MSGDDTPRFQTIPVPNEHVPAVLAFLGDLISNRPSLTAPTAAAATISAVERGLSTTDWTDADLIRFATMPARTSTTVVRLMDLLVKVPGKDGAKSTREAASEIGVDYSVMKALPTHVRRMLAAHVPGLDAPYWGLWGTKDFSPSRTDEMYYAVTRERAEQWLGVRSEISEGPSHV
jgi:hypothetical protein